MQLYIYVITYIRNYIYMVAFPMSRCFWMKGK